MTPHLESQVEAPVEDKGKQNAKAERRDAHSVSLKQLYQVGLTRTLLVWFLLLSLLPLTVVSGIEYLQSEQALRTDTLKALTQRTDLQATFISNWFDYRFRDLRAQAENDSNTVFLQNLETGFKNSGQPLEQFIGSYRWETIVASHKNHLHSLSQIYDYYYDIFLIDLQGNILFSVTRESDLGTNLFTGPYKETLFAATVKQSLTTGQSLFSDLERYAPSNNTIAGFLTAPIIDKNGDKMGVYAVQIEVDRINEEVGYQGRSSDHNSEYSYLIGEDLQLRSAYPSYRVLENFIETEQSQRWKQEPKQTSEENHSTDEVFEYIGPAGQKVLGVLHTLTLNNISWGLISEVDKTQAFAPARELAWLTFALVALVVVLVVFFAIWLAQRFVSPLSHLLQVVDAATQGELDHHVDLKLENEIGQLGDAFNEMLTARQGYEIELNEQHQQMEQALDELAEQRFAIDQHAIVSTTDLAGTITFVNEKFAEVSGYSAEESIGQNHRIVNSGHHPKEFFKEMYQTIRSGAVWKAEVCNQAKDGLIYWVDSTIVPIMDTDHKPKGYISIRTDITSRKLSEGKESWHNQATRGKFRVIEALSEQVPLELRLDHAIDQLFELEGLTLLKKAGIFILNEEGTELSLISLRGDFGAPFVRNEIKHPFDFGVSGQAIISGDVIVRDHCTEQHRHDHNQLNMSPHGHYIIPLTSSNLQGETKATGVLFLYTEPDPVVDEQRISLLLEIGALFSGAIMRHSVIKSYQKATLDAQTASIAKSEFLANMSHEIRTPMNGVLGMLKLLQVSELSAKQHHQANLARSSAEALLSLINDILDFSKIEADKLELENVDFDIHKMIGDMSESMALQAQEKGLEMILDLSAITLSHLKGDPGRLRQLLVNIVGNAIKFTENGEITICLGIRDADEHGMILYGSVADTGMGIPQEKLDTLFDSFSQVDASTTRHFGGTGLGLSICKSLSELMGGGLTVGSTLGKGSRFEFTLTMQHSELATTVEPSVDITNRRILVVDDNTSNREVLCHQLQIWGADVTPAKDASHALAIMEQELDRPFSVIFIDMQMPGIAGPALGQAIRAEPSYDESRLVMMTPMGELGDSNFFTSLGFNAHFPKPTTTADLCNALLQILDGEETIQASSPTIRSQPAPKKPFRILLVEDNEINQEVALGVLEILGYGADVANHGLEAIDMLNNAPIDNPYSIILMDCQMPEMDGYTATGEIRVGTAGNRYQQISIVAMTANAMLGDKEKCLDAGMDDYLTKPLDPDKLEAILHFYEQKNSTDNPPESGKQNELRQEEEGNSTSDGAIVTWNKAEALQRVRGKEKFLISLIKLFLEDMPLRFEELNTAVEQMDFDSIGSVAHAIKGVSANLSGIELSKLSSEMEQNATKKLTEATVALLPTLMAEYEQLTKTFQSYLDSRS